jgi:hypothetical protein
MTEIDTLKAHVTHVHVNFEDIEDLRKGWAAEGVRMSEINAVATQMEFVRDTTSGGLSSGLGTRGLHDFLAAHSFLVDLVKDVTGEASKAFEECIAKTLKGIGQIYKDAEDKNLRELARLGVTDWKPPTKAEVQADYWQWRNR